MDDIGADLKNTIANQLSAGRQFRVCFDNMDFRVLVNIILKNHQNSDKHWIAHYLTFDRVSCQGLDNNKPLVSDSRAFDNINYLLSKDELETLRNNFIVLVARVLLEFFDFMKPFVKAVPAHIKHRLVQFFMNNALTRSWRKEAAALLCKFWLSSSSRKISHTVKAL